MLKMVKVLYVPKSQKTLLAKSSFEHIINYSKWDRHLIFHLKAIIFYTFATVKEHMCDKVLIYDTHM